MKKKSLKVNAILNGSKTVLGIIFPLITLPYVTRTIQVNNLGKVNFSYSIVNYFILLSGLGIATYATREGAKLRSNREELNNFVNQMFTLNIISTSISYFLLVSLVNIIPKLNNYKQLISIHSICIIGGTLGISWIYQIYEDYFYITLRTLVFQILSLCLLFILVKSPDDYYRYAWITVISNVGANIFNLVHSRKYIKLKIIKKIDFKKHITPIMTIFASNIAVIIYVNSDTSMIGFLCGDNADYNLGLYSTSVKVYTILKTLVSALTMVALPRLSTYIYNNDTDKYNKTIEKIFNYLLLFLIPIVVGLNVVAKPIIYIVGGEKYLPAVTALHILSFSLLFSVLATYFTNAILIPSNMEKGVLKSTIISATLNFILNLFFIPRFYQNGAALTTLISEMVVCIMLYYYAKSKAKLSVSTESLRSIFIGSLSIIIVYCIIRMFEFNLILEGILIIIISIFIYFIILILCGNNEVKEIMKSLVSAKKSTG